MIVAIAVTLLFAVAHAQQITLPESWLRAAGELVANSNFNFTTAQSFLGQVVRFVQGAAIRFGADFESDRVILANGTMLYTDNSARFVTRELVVNDGASQLNGTFDIQQRVTINPSAALLLYGAAARAIGLLPNLFRLNGTMTVRGSLLIDTPLDITALRVDSLACEPATKIFLFARQPQPAITPAHAIVVTNHAALDGELYIVLREEYQFPAGYRMPIMQYASHSGLFNRIRVLRLVNVPAWSWWGLANSTAYAVDDSQWAIYHEQYECYAIYTPSPTTTVYVPPTTTTVYVPPTTTTVYVPPTTTTVYVPPTTTTVYVPPTTTTVYVPPTTTTQYAVDLPYGWVASDGEIRIVGQTTINVTRTFTQVLYFEAHSAITVYSQFEATSRVVFQHQSTLIVEQDAMFTAQRIELNDGALVTLDGNITVREEATIEKNATLYLALHETAPLIVRQSHFVVEGAALTVRGSLKIELGKYDRVHCNDLVFEYDGKLILVIDYYDFAAANDLIDAAIMCTGDAAFNGELIIMFKSMPATPIVFRNGHKILIARYASWTGSFVTVRFEQALWYTDGEWQVKYEADKMYLIWVVRSGPNDDSAASSLLASFALLVALACKSLF